MSFSYNKTTIYKIFFDTFLLLLKYLIRILLILPIVLFIFGIKTNSQFFKNLAIKLFFIGLFLSILLTILYYI